MIEWIKLYIKTLSSTIRQDLEAAERGTFFDFCLLAAQHDPDHGRFVITDIDALARQLNTDVKIIEETLKKCKMTNRIKVKEKNGTFVCTIRKWFKYQSFTGEKVDSHKAPKNEKADSRYLHREDKTREDKTREEKKREEEGKNPSISSLSSLKNSEEKKTPPAIISEQYLKLAALFAEEWKSAHPDLRTSPSQKMTDAEVFRSMIEEDRIDLALIESVIKSWRHNLFWRSALTGAEHFCKKFQQLIQARDEDFKKGLLGIDEYVKWAINDEAEISRVRHKKKDLTSAESALLNELSDMDIERDLKDPGR